MKWWLDDGASVKSQSAKDGLESFSRLRRVAPQILLATGFLALTSCSKVSPSQTAQNGATPAASPSAVQTVFSFLSSFDHPPAPTNAAPPDLTSAPANAPAPAIGAPAAGPAPAQVATLKVHPATGAKEAAMKMYPQLGVKDSTFNKVFRDLYAEEMQKNPELLTRAEWPLTLAHRTANLLAQPVVPAGRSMPGVAAGPAQEMPPARPTRATPTPATALNRGAYDQRRSPYWWGYPWVRYY